MEHIRITYHMSRPGEVAETCIVLPMTARIAADVLEHQDDSEWVADERFGSPIIKLLNGLAVLQEYDYAEFVMAEPQEKNFTED